MTRLTRMTRPGFNAGMNPADFVIGLKQILEVLKYWLRIFGTRIIKLKLEYSLRSHDPAHVMCLPSRNDTEGCGEWDVS